MGEPHAQQNDEIMEYVAKVSQVDLKVKINQAASNAFEKGKFMDTSQRDKMANTVYRFS
jgi:hypothetical protein